MVLIVELVGTVMTCQAAAAASYDPSMISANIYSACALESGKAYCWGSGALGDGSITSQSDTPAAVDTTGLLAGKTLTQITTGDNHACALDTDGRAYCWGSNPDGGLGDGTTTGSGVPVAVDTSGVLAGKKLIEISAGAEGSTCALASTGVAYCWGDNGGGELGDGSMASSTVPVAVDTSGPLAGKKLTQISSGGEDNTCALDSAGAAYCWGYNAFGQLGDGTDTLSTTPVTVDTSGVLAGKKLIQISAGGMHACALDSAGDAYCWGYGLYGELGDGDPSGASASTPVAVDTSGVLAGKALTQITAGWVHTCALDTTGTAYCWGENGAGALGDGATADARVPMAVDTGGVLAGKTLAQISASQYSTCALGSTGALYCWGYNYVGELGDGLSGTQNDTDVPVLTGPQAPSDVMATPGDGTATVSWSAPASLDGGSLTGYNATASPGGETCTTTTTTCTLTGLANGTTYEITVVAHTTAGDSGASADVMVTPGQAVTFTSDPSDNLIFGVAFNFTVTTSGSPRIRITKTGKVPPGVRFTPHTDGTATISGTPRGNAQGEYKIVLSARNCKGSATQKFTLTVNRAPSLSRIRTIRAKVGVAVARVLKSTGFPEPMLTESGALPAGLTFTDNKNGSAVITGIPAAHSVGRYPITVYAANGLGEVSQTFILKVR